ncbi:hypothetical protein ACSTS3_14620 [Aquimarina muelleri]|uniref:hypothetical protein n=1 Tax=Aquimarina muelleri TaxID=279356 RepID=UPI003F682A75
MKTTISCFILLLFFTGINAQEIKITDPTTTNEIAAVSNNKNTDIPTPITLKAEQILEDDACYSEISKITFYEALIRQNEFEISLDNKTLDLKNTENITNL